MSRAMPYSPRRTTESAKRSGVILTVLCASIGLPAMALVVIVAAISAPNVAVVGAAMTYHCDSCGNEFEVTPPDPSDPTAGVTDDPMMGPQSIKCTKCDKKTAWLMNRCYKCKKLFAAKAEEHDPRYDGTKLVCPHCGKNQIEYLKEMLKK